MAANGQFRAPYRGRELAKCASQMVALQLVVSAWLH